MFCFPGSFYIHIIMYHLYLAAGITDFFIIYVSCFSGNENRISLVLNTCVYSIIASESPSKQRFFLHLEVCVFVCAKV